MPRAMPDETSSSEPPPAARPRRPDVGVDVATADGRAPLSRAAVQRLVHFILARQRVRHAIVSVAFISNRRMAALNRRIMGRRGATDVISLAFRRQHATEPVIGDIYIASAVVRANARAAGGGIREETARVITHGVLHTLGRDHPERAREASAMWRLQERLLARARAERLW